MWKRDETPKAPPARMESEPEARPVKSSGAQATIGASLVVEGSVRGQEDLLVEGRVEGDIRLPSNTVTVGPTGKVKATIEAKVIVVEGKVDGDLVGAEQIEIRRSGHVLGNITAPRVGLEDGAQFKGNIDMSPKKSAAPTASPTPDRARTETPGQMNNPKHDQAPGTTADKKFPG